MGNFRKLEVWQLAIDLVIYIYDITNSGEFARDYDLKSQIRRAAVSIPSNIAEGDESGSNPQSIRYFNIAKGSSAEIQTQIEIAYKIGYISKLISDEVIDKCVVISKKLYKLIQSRSQ
ncbi:four helix bundle protein [bacterium]|nr:MAG: four helix bundle protein [bacterium]